MYNISWQIIPFPYNVNKERIFVAITNHASQVKFIVMASSCTSTFGKLKEIWEREMINTKNYLNNIETEIEILFACLVFAISISYNGVHNSFHPVSALKQVAKLFIVPFLVPQYP